MTKHFTWIRFYRESAELLVEWEKRQGELIRFIEGLRSAGLKVTPLMDRGEEDAPFLLQEIDPFTFFGIFNRGIADTERISILAEIKKKFGVKSPLPDDFEGIPVLNNQRSWFFANRYNRQKNDIPKLWRVFRLALNENPIEDPVFHEAFDEALKVWGVSVNLKMGLFWIRPDRFLNLDKTNREYLNIKLPSGGLTWNFYVEKVKFVRETGKSFPEISFDAWNAAQNASTVDVTTDEEQIDFWLVGAFWSDQFDQTKRFLEEGIWQNGYDDKYLDNVRSMKVGDKIAIKSSSTQKRNLPFDAGGNTVSKLTIKARGTIIANRGDGKTVEVEWDQEFKQKEWYFFTNRGTVWHLNLDDDYGYVEYSRELINFIWQDIPQNYEWFLERYGDGQLQIEETPTESLTSIRVPYSIDDIIDSGVFMEREEIEKTICRLKSKKNLIIQGPPGVGKTFIAKKLAYALIE